MEKSKTTPDGYPMSFSGLTTGCNQKSNRAPIMNLTQEQVEETVEQMRLMGAVILVQGSGRVDKIRHNGYQWLGLNKVEAAVMTELLLRGEQTLGELRTRASRMEPIPDLDQLKTILDGLKQRDLVVELTPAGRGQIITHNVYPEWELEQLKKAIAAGGGILHSGDDEEDDSPAAAASTSHAAKAAPASANLSQEVKELKELVDKLSQRISFLEDQLGVKLS
jgi:uncharacterized protein YceH (UPF0502 family)